MHSWSRFIRYSWSVQTSVYLLTRYLRCAVYKWHVSIHYPGTRLLFVYPTEVNISERCDWTKNSAEHHFSRWRKNEGVKNTKLHKKSTLKPELKIKYKYTKKGNWVRRSICIVNCTYVIEKGCRLYESIFAYIINRWSFKHT